MIMFWYKSFIIAAFFESVCLSVLRVSVSFSRSYLLGLRFVSRSVCLYLCFIYVRLEHLPILLWRRHVTEW
jgi:hypothetical protein